MPPKAFLDMHRLPEDERIVIIGEYALANPSEKLAVCVDDEPDKPERYKRKIETKYPQLQVEIVGKGPTPGVVTIKVSHPPMG